MVHTLAISPDYVSHWGLWEAVRELLQNAFDARDADSGCEVTITHQQSELRIKTSRGRLETRSLLLGYTTKKDDDAQRGKFGEGYKLALLVLRRLGHDVFVKNRDEVWTPEIEYDEEFEGDVLNIYVGRYEPIDLDLAIPGVEFVVGGVTEGDWHVIQRNMIVPEEQDIILFAPEEVGRIYVGGLFVTNMDEFKAGYNLSPKSIKLDRDRGMVAHFDLSYLTSKLWSEQRDVAAIADRIDKLIEDEAPDVAYVVSHAPKSAPFVSTYVERWTARYPGAMPVTTKDEIDRATAAGKKWVLVPKLVKALLGKVLSLFIPSSESPLTRLEKFAKRVRYSIPEEDRNELEDIITTLKGQT